ncbi:hypothetical protein [Nocardia wallacei]|uniref:hypothetical protein n=1 Tax=Nocardia wallacei TaxID=480035 RepID=UPI002458AE8B|nr:hypothetical protein [Nocardia wallacei]
MSDLPQLLAEYERVSAALVANFRDYGWGRGKQAKRRTAGALRRGAKYSEQLRQLENQIRAAGGEVPGFASKRESTPKPVRPEFVGPRQPDPRTMTREALKAEDVRLDEIRKAAGRHSITDRHRAVKSALGAYAAADIRARAAVRRSEAAKRGAATRAKRKAAGLPPKHLECFMPPPGGWTEADRVSPSANVLGDKA